VPPLVITYEELDRFVDVFVEAMKTCAK